MYTSFCKETIEAMNKDVLRTIRATINGSYKGCIRESFED